MTKKMPGGLIFTDLRLLDSLIPALVRFFRKILAPLPILGFLSYETYESAKALCPGLPPPQRPNGLVRPQNTCLD